MLDSPIPAITRLLIPLMLNAFYLRADESYLGKNRADDSYLGKNVAVIGLHRRLYYNFD